MLSIRSMNVMNKKIRYERTKNKEEAAAEEDWKKNRCRFDSCSMVVGAKTREIGKGENNILY